MEIAEWSEFQEEYRIREAIPCVQQIVDVSSAHMTCWPCGRVGVDVAQENPRLPASARHSSELTRVEAEAHKRNGVWRDVTSELEGNPELAHVGLRGDSPNRADTELDSDGESYSYSYSPSEQVDYSA